VVIGYRSSETRSPVRVLYLFHAIVHCCVRTSYGRIIVKFGVTFMRTILRFRLNVSGPRVWCLRGDCGKARARREVTASPTGAHGAGGGGRDCAAADTAKHTSHLMFMVWISLASIGQSVVGWSGSEAGEWLGS
jgi:hypothetical protein